MNNWYIIQGKLDSKRLCNWQSGEMAFSIKEKQPWYSDINMWSQGMKYKYNMTTCFPKGILLLFQVKSLNQSHEQAYTQGVDWSNNQAMPKNQSCQDTQQAKVSFLKWSKINQYMTCEPSLNGKLQYMTCEPSVVAIHLFFNTEYLWIAVEINSPMQNTNRNKCMFSVGWVMGIIIIFAKVILFINQDNNWRQKNIFKYFLSDRRIKFPKILGFILCIKTKFTYMQ